MAKKQFVKAQKRILATQEAKPIALDDAKTMTELVASVAATPPEERDAAAIYAATERIVGKV